MYEDSYLDAHTESMLMGECPMGVTSAYETESEFNRPPRLEITEEPCDDGACGECVECCCPDGECGDCARCETEGMEDQFFGWE